MGGEWFQLCFPARLGFVLIHDGFEPLPSLRLRVDLASGVVWVVVLPYGDFYLRLILS